MKPEIEEALVKAALKNEAGRDDFIKTLNQVPLNKENFDNALQCAIRAPAQQWVMEVYTPQLLPILSNPHGWDDWVQDFPFLDELILSASQDPQWLEALSFRWTISDGRPEGGPRTAARSNSEREEFFSACWKAAIASDNTLRLEQMLHHPVWKNTLKEEHVRAAIWRSLDVWRVFHDNHTLPLRSFWHAIMVTHHLEADTDNHKKLHFLISHVGSTDEFVVQQYTNFWHHPLPQDLNDAFATLASEVVLDKSNIQKFHQRVANFLLTNTINTDFCPEKTTTRLQNTPLFDGEHFILALLDFKGTLTDHQSAVVEAVFHTLDHAIQKTLLPSCAAHPAFEHLAFVQKHRIEQNIEGADTTVRSKKI